MTPSGRRHLRRDEQLISPLVPTSLAGRPPPAPAPLPMLPTPRLPIAAMAQRLLVETTRVDHSGRLFARGLLQALGWTTGHRVEITVTAGVVVIGSAPTGLHAVDGRGQLALPVTARRMCAITPGLPVLLAASLPHDVLVVHPADLIAVLLTDWYAATAGERDGT